MPKCWRTTRPCSPLLCCRTAAFVSHCSDAARASLHVHHAVSSCPACICAHRTRAGTHVAYCAFRPSRNISGHNTTWPGTRRRRLGTLFGGRARRRMRSLRLFRGAPDPAKQSVGAPLDPAATRVQLAAGPQHMGLYGGWTRIILCFDDPQSVRSSQPLVTLEALNGHSVPQLRGV